MAGPQRPDGVPEEVLTASGLADAVPARLPGGQGTAWRAGPVVLKPVDSLQAGRWFADLYDTLTGPGFRVPRPVRALSRGLGRAGLGRLPVGARCRGRLVGRLAALAGAGRGEPGAARDAGPRAGAVMAAHGGEPVDDRR